LGIGAEYDLPYVKPFVSWRVDVPVNGPDEACSGFNALNCPQQEGFLSYPNKLTLGARAEPIERLGIHAGVDVGLTPRQAQGLPATAPYTVFAGVSWQIDPTPPVQRVERKIVETRRVAPKRYHLTGSVVDKKTGEPVGRASVIYPDRDRSAQMTGEAGGDFRSYGFEPGSEVSMRITHPDYKSTSVTKKVAEEDGSFSVELEPKPRMATIKGQVTDPDGEPVQNASVKYTGPTSGSLTTDAAGRFSTEIEAGRYTVAVSADEYQTAGQDIEPEVDATVQLAISLREKPDENLVEVEDEKITIQQKISFESGSATIKQESYAILNQVAATLFERPKIKRVEVQGHTDDVGEKQMNMELSQNRAEAVKRFLMEQGVSSSRLAAEGYGPTRPRVPNISAANRRLNRRVEFKILERK
jgi:outer membrane protein OmpA-like peptidoglycan-associated protein